MTNTGTAYKPETKLQRTAFNKGLMDAWNLHFRSRVVKPEPGQRLLRRAYREGYWQAIAERDRLIPKAMEHGIKVGKNTGLTRVDNEIVDFRLVSYLKAAGRLESTRLVDGSSTHKALSIKDAADAQTRKRRNKKRRLARWGKMVADVLANGVFVDRTEAQLEAVLEKIWEEGVTLSSLEDEK